LSWGIRSFVSTGISFTTQIHAKCRKEKENMAKGVEAGSRKKAQLVISQGRENK
jgi:hypothetical protein